MSNSNLNFSKLKVEQKIMKLQIINISLKLEQTNLKGLQTEFLNFYFVQISTKKSISEILGLVIDNTATALFILFIYFLSLWMTNWLRSGVNGIFGILDSSAI